MENKQIIFFLDGSKERRTKLIKEYFGLRPDQTFQDLVIEGIDDDDFAEYDEEIERKYRDIEEDD